MMASNDITSFEEDKPEESLDGDNKDGNEDNDEDNDKDGNEDDNKDLDSVIENTKSACELKL